MHKKKLLISRVITLSMVASLIVPSTVYATETTEPVVEEQIEAPLVGTTDIPMEEIPKEPAIVPDSGNTTTPEKEETTQPPKNTVDLSKIVKDYQGNYWIPVNGGFARCNPNDGSLLGGYAIVTAIPAAPQEKPQEPALPKKPDAIEGNPVVEDMTTLPDAIETETPTEEEQTEAPQEELAEVESAEQITPPVEGVQSNQGLIANQQIIIPPKIEESFRFVTVEKQFAIVLDEKLQIYEEMNDQSRAIGEIAKDGLCFVLKEVKPEELEADEVEAEVSDTQWVYIESGVARGFVKAESILKGDEAKALVEEKKEENLHLAQALVDPFENKALAYTRTTTRTTVVDKVYAIANAENVNIREEKSTESRILGTMAKGALCYILADATEEWIYVESEDVRGFVRNDFLIQGEEALKLVVEQGEETMQLAVQEIEPAENAACYYTLTSTKEGMIASAIRSAMIEFSTQFLGNPYVWGGTSLTNGADCSGFVQSIYSQFGYSIPRTSREQALYGMQIPVEEAVAGDLIFYAKDGVVYHVVMAMGNGQVIHASGRKTGIITSGIDTEHAVWATRLIQDTDTDTIKMVNSKAEQNPLAYTLATSDQFGDLLGNFKLTAYCNCAQCCGQWAGGPTASGTMPTEGRTVAMGGIEFGTKLIINGQLFTVEDRGTPFGHVDIYMNDHDVCNEFGVSNANVFLAK